MTAAERAAAELEEFAAQAHADLDRNAPPAIKSSPSVSGGEDGKSSPLLVYHAGVAYMIERDMHAPVTYSM